MYTVIDVKKILESILAQYRREKRICPSLVWQQAIRKSRGGDLSILNFWMTTPDCTKSNTDISHIGASVVLCNYNVHN